MKTKVLVCDDDASILDLLQIVLSEFGYTVITCADGSLVVGLVEKHNPDIIMLDIWMPKVDGRQTLKQIKQAHNIPVILISALHNLPDIAEQNGADGYLEKPFAIKDVRTIVEKHLPKKPSIPKFLKVNSI